MTALKNIEGLKEKLLSNCIPEPNSGCWLWLRGVNSRGYGVAWHGGRLHGAHRLAYRAFSGEIAAGLDILHSCDQPGCINPEHLRCGSASENAADMVRRGRSTKGERQPNRKLADEDVRKILTHAGSQKEVAMAFNVSQSLVSRIRNRHRWSHVA